MKWSRPSALIAVHPARLLAAVLGATALAASALTATGAGRPTPSAEVFTEADAQTLVSFATQDHLGRLAFWSVDRDQPCGRSASGLSARSKISQQPLDFTKIFLEYTGRVGRFVLGPTAWPPPAEYQASPPMRDSRTCLLRCVAWSRAHLGISGAGWCPSFSPRATGSGAWPGTRGS